MENSMKRVAAVVAFSFGLIAAGASAAEQKAPAKPDAAKGSTIANQVCGGCHGADGNSVAPANPKLAGQHPEYLVKQLNNFRVQPGAQKAERENAIMAAFASTLSPEDMSNLAAYYSTQKPKGGAAKNKDTLELGQKIYRGGIAEKNIPACAGCHSPNGAGIPAQYPRLSGQHAEYTESQLVGFRGGVRKNNQQMMAISARLSDAEIKAVSDYIAGLN
jgi:cytochrome c553